uniref:Uncharacterized protein n=1 Tax=Anguilla anguilla TaxID=7936 RepID=A0A0E9XVP8_ANGAN
MKFQFSKIKPGYMAGLVQGVSLVFIYQLSAVSNKIDCRNIFLTKIDHLEIIMYMINFLNMCSVMKEKLRKHYSTFDTFL